MTNNPCTRCWNEVIYSPFADSFQQPDLLQGWNPYFSISGFPSVQGQIGIGTGFHLTSLNGATLSIQWHGTAIQLFGNATQASYSITLDGYPTQPNSSLADSVLAHLTDLPSTNHNLSLSVQIPSPTSNNSFLAFQNAAISATSATGSNQTSPFESLDDSDIAFHGDWTFENSDQISFHQSTTSGDRALALFYGTAFIIFGTISPTSSTYSVTLNSSYKNVITSSVTTTLSARSSFTQYNTSLFVATGLNETEMYSAEVLNVDGGLLQLDVGGFSIAGSSPLDANSSAKNSTMSSSLSNNNTSYSAGTLAALALAGILLFLLISSALYYFAYHRPRSRRRRLDRRSRTQRRREPETGEVMDIRRPNRSDEPSWRKRFRLGLPYVGDVNGGGGGGGGGGSSLPPRGGEKDETPTRATKRDSILSTPDQDHPKSPRFAFDLPSLPIFPPQARIRSPPRPPPPPLSPSEPNPSVPLDTYFSDRDVRPAPSTSNNNVPVIRPPRPPVPPPAPAPAPATAPHPSSPPPGSPTHRGSKRSGSTFFYTPNTGSPVTPGGDNEELEYLDDYDETVRQLSPRTSERLGNTRIERDMRFPSGVSSEGNGDTTAGDSFLRVRDSSPFRVDFPQHQQQQRERRGSRFVTSLDPSRSRLSGQSRVRFQVETESAEPPLPKKEGEGETGEDKNHDNNNVASASQQPQQEQQPQSSQSPPQPILRASAPPVESDRDRRGAVVSFLEFGNSSPSGSLITHSSSGDSSQRPPERSRWSSTTAQSGGTFAASLGATTTNFSLGGSEYSRPSTTAHQYASSHHSSFPFPFPFAVVGPGDRHHHHHHHPQSDNYTHRTNTTTQSWPTHIHHPFSDPSANTGTITSASSTDSVPMSVSDIRFRHSDSDDGANHDSRRTSLGSHLPPHPPLPGEQTQTQTQTPQPQIPPTDSHSQQSHSQHSHQSQTGLFFGGNTPGIVERVLGLRPYDSSTNGRTPPRS